MPRRRVAFITGITAAAVVLAGVAVPVTSSVRSGAASSALTVHKDVKDLTAAEKRAFIGAIKKKPSALRTQTTRA